MLEKLKTYASITGQARLAADISISADHVLRGIVCKIPTHENGTLREVEFIPTITEGCIQRIEAAFSVSYEAVADAFALEVSGEKASIYADTRAGLVYGAYALVQQAQANGGAVETGLIYNVPLCPFRGFHVYLPDPEDFDSFYSTVDFLAYLRYNTVILEVGGGMEYKKHPEINRAWAEFCSVINSKPVGDNPFIGVSSWHKNSSHTNLGGGKIVSQAQMRELIRYCTDRGIHIIPEAQTLSHCYYLAIAHPELKERAEDIYPDTYCPSHPDTYKLVFDVMDEIIEVFDPKVIHIGHDEWYSIGLCPRCKGKDAADLFAGDITKIHDYLASKGVRTMMWSDKLINTITLGGSRHGGGEERRVNDQGISEIITPATWRAIDRIPRDIIILHWYWSIDDRYDEEFHKRGFPLCFGNFYPDQMPAWKKRQSNGALGGAPSIWWQINDEMFQRSTMRLMLTLGARLFWDRDYEDSKYPEALQDSLLELFLYCNREALHKPHFEIVHTTSIFRDYVMYYNKPIQGFSDTLGHYLVTYEDGSTFEIPIVYGRNITNGSRTWDRVPGWVPGENFIDRVAYVNDFLLNEVSCSTLPIRREQDTVFKIAVENPHPQKKVTAVDIIKAGDAGEGEITLCSFDTVNLPL